MRQTIISSPLRHALFFICLLISYFSVSAQWSYMDFIQYPELNKNITGMHFFDGNHGVLSANNFYSSGDGEIMWTQDGGQSWTTDTVFPDTFNWTRTLVFLTDSIGLVAADGNILRTSDQGQSWSIVFTPGGSIQLDFSTPNIGYSLRRQDGTMYKTTDAGVTWNQGNPAHPYYSYSFLNATTGILASYPNGGTQSSPSILYRTTNGGTTWDSLFTLSDTTWWGYPFFFENPQMDCLEDTCLVVDGWSNLHARTLDGGVNWDIWQDTTQIMQKSFVKIRPDGTTFAGSDFMIVLSSTNYGDSWTAEHSTSATPATVTSFCFRDSACTFAIGDFGVVESGCFPLTQRDQELENHQERLQIYPNPAQEVLYMELRGEVGEDVQLEVYNQLGQLIKRVYQGELDAKQEKFALQTGQFPQGMYHVRLWTSKSETYKSFIITP